jgi:predicted nucleotide-binding protein (sugar kinase/HSP70/actin superfamily)
MQSRRAERVRPRLAAHTFAGRKVWVPRMSDGSSLVFAAALRSVGLDADATPPSDERTRELGARHSSGDECYPLKVTLGDFLKVLEQPGLDPAKTAFFMPGGCGPCRFGQYAPYLRHVLDALGHPETLVISPTDGTGYTELGEFAGEFLRTGWRAVVAADLLLKLLLKSRPYEIEPGSADETYQSALADLCRTLEVAYASAPRQLEALRASLLRARDSFRRLPIRFDPERPFIGVIGEIFCRLSPFSNDDIVRKFEEHGAECWMSDIGEWVAYANAEQRRRLRLRGRSFSFDMLGAQIRSRIQKKDEHELVSLFHEDFRGYEEPENIHAVLKNAEPYLPSDGAMGEMVINAGRAVHLARRGVDGIVDISPFTCMNGIVCEAIYPRLSADLGGIPIQTFYFDGTASDLDRDIGIYLELARSYRARKPFPRTLPAADVPRALSAHA